MPSAYLWQDNVPQHRARAALAALTASVALAASATLALFHENNIDLMKPWPPSSSNINPVDNL